MKNKLKGDIAAALILLFFGALFFLAMLFSTGGGR